MNKSMLKKTGFILAAAGMMAVQSGAAEKFSWKENFRNYNDKAPGITDSACSVGNDPIWVSAAELNFNDNGDKERAVTIYDKAISVPNLKDVTLSFSYKFRNAVEPVTAKPEIKDKNGKVTQKAVAAVAGTPKKFTVRLNGLSVVIGSDFIDINKHTFPIPFLANHKWEKAAIQLRNGKVTVFTGVDRKLKQVAQVPYPDSIREINFTGYTGNAFSISDIVIEEKSGIRFTPAAGFFADFKSLTQKISGTPVKTSVTLKPGDAGVQMVLNEHRKPVKMTLNWNNGKKDVYEIASSDETEQLIVPLLGKKKHEKTELADAKIQVGKLAAQYVRPKLRRFRSSYDAVPAYSDIIRDWDSLPSASKHVLDLQFAEKDDNTVLLYLDGSFAASIRKIADEKAEAECKKEIGALGREAWHARNQKKDAELKAINKKIDDANAKLASLPLAKLLSVELEGNGTAEFSLKTAAKKTAKKYTMLDLAANPKAKTFANAEISPAPGVREIGGIPYNVVKALDSADVAIAKEGKGNWALEVDEYLSRAPVDGFPGEVHFRLPAAPYSIAHIICAVDPDPEKDVFLTARIGRHNENGTGGNMIADTVIDGLPKDAKQVGTVTLNGKALPLYQISIPLATGKITDLAARSEYLDFEFLGKGSENLQQIDNRMKPDPNSSSAFSIFAVTLEQAPAVMDMKQLSPGNVFTEDEKAETVVVLRAMENNAKGTLSWIIKDVDGKTVKTGDKSFRIAKAGDKQEITIPLNTAVGYYDLDITMTVDGKTVFLHPARFAILGKDTRKATKEESPYATWWFNAHGSPGEAEIGGPIMQKAGIRKCSWVFPTEEMVKKYNIINTGNLMCPGMRNFDAATGKFKPQKIRVADPSDPKKMITKEVSGEEWFVQNIKEQMKPWGYYDHILIWHESAPGYGIPEELLNMPITDEIKKQIESDKRYALYVNESGRLLKKYFPNLRIQIGNSSASVGAATRPLRAGADQKYYDAMGMETPAQSIPPERLTEVGLQGMKIAQEIASKLAKRPVPLNGSWEFAYRADRDIGEQKQAEWHMRDILICLANNYTLISPGILFDCKNSYYNGLWGGAGILLRGPYVYPKRAYVAYAALTKALDRVKFTRQIDTGSTTVYALEYKRADGKYVTALWSARGNATFGIANGSGSALVTELYGRETTVKGKEIAVKGGSAPVYVTTAKPLDGVKILERSFPEEEARAAKGSVAASFDNTDLLAKAEPDEIFTSQHNSFLPILKPGKFSVQTVQDAEKGSAIQVKLDVGTDPYKSKYITEFTTLELKEPKALAGKPAAIGVWVKGNSNWGQIRFTIEDAQGEIFHNLTTGRSWGCDIQDWSGELAVNFDGWCFVATHLRPNTLFTTNSPGPVSDQWVSAGGDKKIDYPVKVRAITVGMNRTKLNLLDWSPADPVILLKDVTGIEE